MYALQEIADRPVSASEVNQPESLPKTASPTASPHGGEFSDEVTIILECATPNAAMFYAADNGPFVLYQTPILWTRSGLTSFRFAAAATEHSDSEIITVTYNISGNYHCGVVLLHRFIHTSTHAHTHRSTHSFIHRYRHISYEANMNTYT